MSHPRKWTRALVRAACVASAILAPAPAMADWRGLYGPEIVAALTAYDVAYDDLAWERHEANGMLLVRSLEGPSGRTSVGEWMVRGDARCLRWNGAGGWECYAVQTDGGDGIRFTDAYGNVSEGRLVTRDPDGGGPR
ncbi:hypothetical protein P6F26_08555 [Roseibacterium sp. SDUM158017]|uniref:hypothetical protein n=1 Tax=Roseicyclus salinarum TaxID=3036773 RepID=UPI0024151E99|nr:hypothetical protein [Roseibacterium sp. SDUM158017]MDG4648495.1 hypothetical protein [Roseibacterium sp. SDUM158017]